MMKLLLILNFLFFSSAESSFKEALKKANAVSFDKKQSFTEDEVLDFQEDVVDVLFTELMKNRSVLNINSSDFNSFIKSIGFLAIHSKDLLAGSYIHELKSKLKMNEKKFWNLIGKKVPKNVVKKLRADYDEMSEGGSHF